jgi:hypothetical protein
MYACARARAKERTGQIDIHDLPPLVERELVRGLRMFIPALFTENVDAAAFGGGLLECIE